MASRLYNPANPLCCGEGAAKHEHFGGTATDRDLVLVNGHWQPRLAMEVGARGEGALAAAGGLLNPAVPQWAAPALAWPLVRPLSGESGAKARLVPWHLRSEQPTL